MNRKPRDAETRAAPAPTVKTPVKKPTKWTAEDIKAVSEGLAGRGKGIA